MTQSSDYACRLTVYLPDGSVQYEYDFSQTYITAVSLNGSGTMGFAAGIQTQDGALVSQLYVFVLIRKNRYIPCPVRIT